jgi:hypothetical protein
VQTARLAQDLIDEEELELEEQEAAEDAELMRQAAKAKKEAAKAKMSRARREVERKRFEINATYSETLAEIEDYYGLDADGWVGTTHGQSLEVDEVPVGSGIGDRVISSQVSMPEFASVTVSTLEVCDAPVVPGFGDSEMKIQVSTPGVANCSMCPEVSVSGNEKLEAVDSANLIRDLAVDAERVLSDRTDVHMNDLASCCGYSENADHDFIAEVPLYVRVAHNAWSSSADENRVGMTEGPFGKSDQM